MYFFLLLLFSAPSVFGLDEHPFYDQRYLSRVYSGSSVQYEILNAPCANHYEEISLEKLTPVSHGMEDFQFENFQEIPFYHPLLRETKNFLALSWNSKNKRPQNFIKIPLSLKVPSFARSFGILLGGDGISKNKLEIVLEEKGKRRIYSLKEPFLKETYSLYLFSLKGKSNSTLKAIYIHEDSSDSSSDLRTQIFLGPISFYNFSISGMSREVETQEKIFTPLSFQLQKNMENDPNFSKNYLMDVEGLWNKDDTLFLDFTDLQPGILEVYAHLQNRFTQAFLLRFLVAGIDHSRAQNRTCIAVSLPQEVISYQQTHNRGTYFNLIGVRWIPSFPTSANTRMEKAFFQKKELPLYTYPPDKE